jgi:vacuolar-type H+-ATPase subunit C/Vma6
LEISEKAASSSEIEIYMDLQYFKTLNELSRRTGNSFLIGLAADEADAYNIKTFYRSMKMGLSPQEITGIFTDTGKISPDVLIEAAKHPDKSVTTERCGKRGRKLIEEGSALIRDGKPLNRLDAISRKLLLEKTSEAAGIVMGPEPVFAYYIKGLHEVTTMNLIYAGKKTSAPGEMIKERVFLPS